MPPKATKRGRPKKPFADRRRNILRVCLTEAERVEIDNAAREAGQDTSQWARERLTKMAKRVQAANALAARTD